MELCARTEPREPASAGRFLPLRERRVSAAGTGGRSHGGPGLAAASTGAEQSRNLIGS